MQSGGVTSGGFKSAIHLTDTRESLNTALAGRYTIESELGRGGMAVVYLAQDLRHERSVALKVLHPELAATLGPERFEREIRFAARLQHPHILPIFDSGSSGGLLWYTMPYVAGEPLRSRLVREGRLSVAEAVRIAREVADALDYAHQQGVVHRDVKPENVLLTHAHALLADFGIAQAMHGVAEERLTSTGFAVGTLAYMSPEQITSDPALDGRTDIYSLGCVLHEMLTGAPPFTGSTPQAILVRRLQGPAPSIEGLRTDVSPGLAAVVLRALAPQPPDRFLSAGALAEALSAAGEPRGDIPAITARIGSGPIPLRRAVGSRARVAGAVLLALGLAALIWDRHGSAPLSLDPNLLAIAPFDVLASDDAFWREAPLDYLARALNGAGQLRTVAPATTLAHWTAKSGQSGDPEADAVELGRRTGAQLVLSGQVVGAGPDSVRVHAALLDVAGGERLGEMEFRGPQARADLLLDSLAFATLRHVGDTRPLGAIRSMNIGTRSIPALKAFLRAEQHYRHMRWDSARFHYERAVLLDSTFAPALYHLARTLEWLNNDDPTAGVIALRAAANNHSLPPRDSLLILADSFGTSAKVGLQPRPEYRLLVRRQLAVLEDATALYPQDPELWHELGEARLHLAFAVGLVQLPETLEAFERAVTLDPGLMEAAFHALELAINLGEPGRAMRTAARLAGDRSARRMGGWHQLAVGLLDSTYASADESIARVDVREVVRAFSLLRAWPDSGETAVRMARRIMQSRDSGSTAVRVPAHRVLAMELARRGHLRQMMRMGEDTAVRYLPYLARLGLVPLTEARAAFEVSLARQAYDTDRRWTVSVSWFAEQRDTARLRRALERAEQAFDSLRRAAPTSPALWKQPWVSEYLRTHLDLAVGDTAAALRRLRHVVDSLCTSCRDEVLLFGHLLAQQGRAHEAAALLQHDHSLAFTWDEWRTGEWALLRAQVAEAIGDQEVARKKYQYVLDLWRHADPEFEPELRAARLGLARVSAEPT